jgi:hypothetical protein
LKNAARDVAVAGGLAAVLSGLPSTLYAIGRGENPLEASLAAGTILLPRERRAARLLVSAAAVHTILSLTWAAVLATVLPRHRRYEWATLAALAIAAVDLGVIGRRFPRVRALPILPQVADHLAYAWTVTAVLHHRETV